MVCKNISSSPATVVEMLSDLLDRVILDDGQCGDEIETDPADQL